MSHENTLPLRVAIADDSVAVRERLAVVISQIPGAIVVGAAKDGREALEQVRTLRPDVLVLDLHMPRLSGLAVLKALGQVKSNTVVIVLTIETEPVYRKKLLQAGADYFLSKATQIGELERVLQELISRQTK